MAQKVVHLVYSFGCGGLEKVIVNLINRSTQYNVEHIIISLTNDISMSAQFDHTIKVITLDKQSGNELTSHRKLFALLKEIKPQVLNTYNFGTLEYHITAKLARVPRLVHSDHGRGGDDPQGKNKLHNLFRRFVSYFLSGYVVVSYDLFNWIENSIKVNKKKLLLIFNGVEVNPDGINQKQCEPSTFVTIGRLDPVKNQTLLINAFAKALNDFDEFKYCQLNIVGEGPIQAQLNEQIKSLGVESSIHLLGYKDNVSEILEGSDVFVLSSIYEAMPMTILEAMANKTPVICTDVGGISKFISSKEAWFVETNNVTALANKMREVKKTAVERNNRVETAFKLVDENYSLKYMVERYMSLYKIGLKKDSK